jgi:hypothetical protein
MCYLYLFTYDVKFHLSLSINLLKPSGNFTYRQV